MENKFDFTDIINNIPNASNAKYNRKENKELLPKEKRPRGRRKGQHIEKKIYIRNDGLIVYDAVEYAKANRIPKSSIYNCANPKSSQVKDSQGHTWKYYVKEEE